MEWIYGLAVFLLIVVIYGYYSRPSLKPYQMRSEDKDDFCVIDIRDYIHAHRSPYPGAENIPLNYLPRFLKERWDCPGNILLVTDDKRGAKLAAKMIRRKKRKSVYYIQSN
ncbi:rhodanese-like domain-containing protein [Halobacillus litoralis]|uniref:rhodanese-like domain-containing protein n=1 Tax=Halobacillus litoralis TaxID=45668 RepID=UPI001CFC6CCF|nr:rhodanese-like domain-containing protein [Halobacillus litoralis]